MEQRGFVFGLAKKMRLGKDSLEQIDGPFTESALREWLIRRIAKQIEVEPSAIDTTERFDNYGLDSIVAVTVAGDIEKVVKRDLSPALLFEHATIDALAAYLAAHLAGELTTHLAGDPASDEPPA
jgi:acyl carrier protein